MAKIVIIDDEPGMDILKDALHFRGHDVQRIASATEALKEIDKVVSSDLVVLDIILPSFSELARDELTRGQNAGMEVIREIRKRKSGLPVIAYSATQDRTIIEALSEDPHVSYKSKWGSPTLRDITQLVNKMLGVTDQNLITRTFIVHGHNDNIKLDLKNYLQNTLHLPEPIVLHEQPNLGRTLIEKFEDYAMFSSIVFVLLTPDDLVTKDQDGDDQKRRARQNVIFEMGYFLGILGRRSGRVLLLYEGPLEIPSDLSGIVYIDISQGIEAAGEKIRREIEHVRC